jgi:hypothetical protein
MDIIRLVTHPVRDLAGAVVMPFKFLFVVGLCAFINYVTYSGYWWFKWVALGMGIAVLVAFARAARTLAVLGLIAWGGWWLHKRYGAQARQRFDDWAARAQPGAAQVLDALRSARPA